MMKSRAMFVVTINVLASAVITALIAMSGVAAVAFSGRPQRAPHQFVA